MIVSFSRFSLEQFSVMSKDTEFDIALSFAGEDRPYVDRVAKLLRDEKVKVFYDLFEEEKLWGKDLYEYLTEIYRDKSLFTIMFISKDYNRKLWTNHERRAMQARAFKESQEYILPARFDNTEIPGFLGTTGYVSLRDRDPKSFVKMILKKLDDSGRRTVTSLEVSGREETELKPQDKSFERQYEFQTIDSINACVKIKNSLDNIKQLREMFCALYLLIKIDQYQEVENNNGLWGWSVCDAFRKKEVAISLEEEPRKASLLVSYFAQSAINDFLQSLNLNHGEQMRETLLDFCYHQSGYFGQPRDIVSSFDAGTISQIIPENIRHTVNSAKALLLLENPNDIDVMQSVINYLKTCKEDRLWSEEPFPYKDAATPDCKTCSQVLEFFSLLESSPLFFNSLTHEDRKWLKDRQSEGLNWLKGHKYQKVLWDYKVDTHKQSSDSLLTLFHTACVLYCCRFYLCNDPQRVFDSSISELFVLLKKEPHFGLLPVSKPDSRPHLCHTAFFLCSLYQKVGTFDDERLKLISRSLDSIAAYFINQFSCDSLDVDIPDLDHYADGWALMLHLSRYLGGAKGLGLSVADIQCLDKQAKNLTLLINKGIAEQLDLSTWKVEVQSALGDFSYLWHLVYQRIIKQRELKVL
jgi:TIR domain